MAAVCAPAIAGAGAPSAVVDIGSRRELFIDDYLIDELKGAELRLHPPVDRGRAFDFDKPWEGEFSAYVTILHTVGKYQALYRGSSARGARNTGDHQVLCYAESPDGVHWTKPELDLFPQGDVAKTNIVLANASPVTHNFSPFIDTRPGVDPQERYKGVGGYHQTGLEAYTSPDGIHWTRRGDKPVLTKEDVGFVEGSNGIVFDSQNVPFWSQREGKYVLFYRVYKDKKRRIARVESDDFVTWERPQLMEYQRRGEPAVIEELYTNQTHPYYRAPHIYVSTAARFMLGRRVLTPEQAKAIGVDPKYFNDTSDAVLMTNRDGATYDRTFMEAFVAPGIGAENWTSRTNYPALNVVQTGPTEMSAYVNQNYGQPTSHLRRYSLRLDGFASVRAGYDGGEMTTRPLMFTGDGLFLNFATSAAGSVRVEVQNEAGEPLPGFALEDCTEIIGNELDRPVEWRGGAVGRWAGTPVRLRLVMKDADLYALRFGASTGADAGGQ